MTPAEISSTAARIVARTCAEQGVPLVVEDPAVLAKVASLLRPGRDSGAHRGPATSIAFTTTPMSSPLATSGRSGRVQRT